MIAIYARVSTEEQARNGYSLQDQIRACRKLANSGDIIEYVDEGISGEILDRPALSRLRDDISGGKIVKVLCLDPDRLSRKLMNQLILSEEIEKRAELLFVNGEYAQTAEGRLFYQLRGAISEFEKAKINERMSRGRREKARQGYIVRDYCIYGYDYDHRTHQLTVNPFEAEIVKMIFNYFIHPEENIAGINGIAKYLTSQGIPTKRGAREWHRQVVRQILMNRAYIGEFYQNRWNCEGMLSNKFKSPENKIPLRERPSNEWILVPCPAILEKDMFLYAQQLIEEARRRWSGVSKNSYLLSGLVRCGICGNTMTGRKSQNWGEYIFEYCDIKGTAGAKNRGCGMRIKTETLDGLVWKSVLNHLKNSPVEDLISQKPYTTPKPSKLIRLSEIEKVRSNLVNMLSSPGEDIGSPVLEDIHRKLRELKAEEELIKHTVFRPAAYMDGSGTEYGNFAYTAWKYYIVDEKGTLSFLDKQTLIRKIVKEITVTCDGIVIKSF